MTFKKTLALLFIVASLANSHLAAALHLEEETRRLELFRLITHDLNTFFKRFNGGDKTYDVSADNTTERDILTALITLYPRTPEDLRKAYPRLNWSSIHSVFSNYAFAIGFIWGQDKDIAEVACELCNNLLTYECCDQPYDCKLGKKLCQLKNDLLSLADGALYGYVYRQVIAQMGPRIDGKELKTLVADKIHPDVQVAYHRACTVCLTTKSYKELIEKEASILANCTSYAWTVDLLSVAFHASYETRLQQSMLGSIAAEGPIPIITIEERIECITKLLTELRTAYVENLSGTDASKPARRTMRGTAGATIGATKLQRIRKEERLKEVAAAKERKRITEQKKRQAAEEAREAKARAPKEVPSKEGPTELEPPARTTPTPPLHEEPITSDEEAPIAADSSAPNSARKAAPLPAPLAAPSDDDGEAWQPVPTGKKKKRSRTKNQTKATPPHTAIAASATVPKKTTAAAPQHSPAKPPLAPAKELATPKLSTASTSPWKPVPKPPSISLRDAPLPPERTEAIPALQDWFKKGKKRGAELYATTATSLANKEAALETTELKIAKFNWLYRIDPTRRGLRDALRFNYGFIVGWDKAEQASLAAAATPRSTQNTATQTDIPMANAATQTDDIPDIEPAAPLLTDAATQTADEEV